MQWHPRRHFLKLLAGMAVFAATRGSWAAEARPVEIRFAAGKPVGADVIRLTQGDTVTFEWQSDTAMDLHLHGYDLEVRLQPGKPVTTPFQAHASGRFPLTSHGAGHGHAALLYIEVHPD
jgi:hypothetical protein